jgi:hypothetical protein
MTLQGNQLIPIRVTVGLDDGTNTEVTSGLQAGQVVVTGQTGGATTAAPVTAPQKGQGSSPLAPVPGKPGG